MLDLKDRQNSILIVSGSEQFNAVAKRALSGKGFAAIEYKKSAAQAQRELLTRSYDIVLIHAPLSDEMGHEFAVDVSERYGSSVILVVPAEIYDAVSDHVMSYGIYVVSKPVDYLRLGRAIRFFLAVQEKVHRYQKEVVILEEKMEELKLVNRAKLILMEKEKMTEEQAHRYIGKQAMDLGFTRRQIAEDIISRE